MAQELTLKTEHKPSFFNKDMVLGGLLGLTVAAFVPGGLVVAALMTAGGAAAGGAVGKHTQETENREGKKVSEGSFWNKDTLIGGLIGNQIGGIIAAVSFVAIAGTALLTAGTLPVLTGAVALGAGVGLAAWAGSTALGAYIGGKSGQKAQNNEYEQAKQQTIVQHLSQNVSPEVGKAVEYTMQHNKSWAKEITEKRMLAEAQQAQNVRT